MIARRLAQAVLVAGVVSLLRGSTQAAPIIVPTVGGPVFVGPTSAHVTALYWNPAAAGLMQGTHVFASAAGRLDWTGVDRLPISSADGEPDPSGDRRFDPESLTALTLGHFIGATTDFRSNELTLSFAIYSPYAESQPEAGPALAYHAAGGSFYGQAIGVGFSWRLENWVTAGMAASLYYSKAHFVFARDTALDSCTTPPCGIEDPNRAERIDVETGWDFPPTSSGSLLLNFGVLLHFADWFIGLSVAPPPSFSSPGFVQKEATVRITRADGTSVVGPSRVTYDLPAILNLGVRRSLFGDYDLVVNVRYIWLSIQEKLDFRFFGAPVIEAGVPEWLVRHRGFSDVFSIEAGLEQAPARAIRLGGRIRFETGAVPTDSAAFGQIDGPKFGLAAGIELRPTPRFAVVLGYSLTLFLPQDVDPSGFSPRARIECNASGFDLESAGCIAVREGRGTPTAAGHYQRIGNELTLALSYDIW